MGLNKNIEPKTGKNSPKKYDLTNVRSNYDNYNKLNNYIKIKRINTGNERNDYSYNINETNNNNYNYNTIKKYEKKPYFKKLVQLGF